MKSGSVDRATEGLACDSGGQWTPLHNAVEHEQLARVTELVGPGADLHAIDAAGWTPLHLAVDVVGDSAHQTGTEPDVAVIELLLRLGADPDRADVQGEPHEI